MESESLHILNEAGVEMIVAIDSTELGPALGGCRWKPYADPEAARQDALALARAMTRKAGLARVALGGGKAVVIGDPRSRSREQLLAFGAFVETLGGRYVTAADMGTGEEEMAVIAERTAHVSGVPRRLGGCGDPAPFTAEGVHLAIEAALSRLGLCFEGVRVAVQGIGRVGSELVRRLLESGASVLAADSNPKVLESLPSDVEIVSPGSIALSACDVFAPCGPPGVLVADRVPDLRCRIVCGAANNPLAEPAVGMLLERRGILYVPDFVANAGGLIHLAVAREGGDDDASHERLRVIPENLAAVMIASEAAGVDLATAAEELALTAVAAGAQSGDLG